MSQPDHEAIVAEIRGTRITASPELRARVLAIAATSPPDRTAERSHRVPAAVAPLVLVAVPAASPSPSRPRSRSASPAPERVAGTVGGRWCHARRARSQGARERHGRAVDGDRRSCRPAATQKRAQVYEAELLRVKDLSATTKRAPGSPATSTASSERRLRLRHRERLREHGRSRSDRERPGGDRRLLGAGRDRRPARRSRTSNRRSTPSSAACRHSAT
jgi:hypothetical protein